MISVAPPEHSLPAGSRSVDLNVLGEPERANHKPYFAPVLDRLAPLLDARPTASVLDIGCSLGGFLNALRIRWPSMTGLGVDIQESVIARARQLHPGLYFDIADVLDPGTLAGTHDVVTMLGVHSLFDEPLVWLDAALRACAPDGRILVFGLFNPEDVDVLARVRWSGTEQGWQTGWNLWSRRTIDAALRERDLDWSWTWTTVRPSFEVERWSEDPLHSWTMQVDGESALVNGTQLVHRQAILEIQPARGDAS